jgi:hypothetical protein
MMYMTRVMLHRMAGMRPDERTWKPNLLVFSGSPSARWYLIELADAIAQSRSFVTVAAFIPETGTPAHAEKITETIRTYLRKRNVPAFIRTLPADDPYAGAEMMVRSYGFGPITPNTVLIGETERPASFVAFAELVRSIHRFRRNLVIVREREAGAEEETEAPTGWFAARPVRRIDLWWLGKSPTAAFMLALAILLRRSDAWEDGRLSFKTLVDTDVEIEAAAARMTQFLAEARITATPDVIVRGGRTHFEAISASSSDAELVFLQMRAPEAGESAEAYSRYYEELLRETETLPATAMVMAGEQVDFPRIFEPS